MKTFNKELPQFLPHGWRTEVAKSLNIHRNTVYKAIKRGEDDITYRKIIHVLEQKYGEQKIK